MNKHTEGPWEVIDPPEGLPVIFDKEGFSEIAHICVPENAEPPEIYANARLIAAAPELLEALIMAKQLINANTLLDAGNPANIKIEAVIAKAKGN